MTAYDDFAEQRNRRLERADAHISRCPEWTCQLCGRACPVDDAVCTGCGTQNRRSTPVDTPRMTEV